METVPNCPICRGTRFRVELTPEDHTVTHERFPIQACSTCGFLFTSPRPAPDQIGRYYLSEDYISHSAKIHGFKDRLYHWVRRHAIKNKHLLIAKHQPQGHALDIGCGTGDFLAHLNAHGYHASGVEVSPEARKIALSKGLSVVTDLGEVPPSQHFNLVTLWHVLEHVPNPRSTLEQIHGRMAEGALLVVAVPDHESWDRHHYGTQWAAWDVPRHLSHFRRQDITKLLSETGFGLIEIRPMWFDAPYVSMLSEQYRGAGPMGSLLKGSLVGGWSNLMALLTKRPTSSSLYLAKKDKTIEKGKKD